MMAELTQEMDELSAAAGAIKMDLAGVRSQSRDVDAHAVCEICKDPAFTQNFIVFPCGHAFHRACMESRIKGQYLSQRKRQYVAKLERQLEQTAQDHENIVSQYDKIRERLEQVLFAECIECGESLIRSVDMPFYDAEDRYLVDQWRI